MIDIPKIVIAPHVTTYVGNLGINEFANDLNKVMSYSPSWERHWRRLTPIKNFQRGDIMIFSYKSNNEWYVVGDGEVLYDGLEEEMKLCQIAKDANDEEGVEWTACYHFDNFRLYPQMIPFSKLEENLSRFKPDMMKYVTITPEDYMRLLALTVTPGND